MLRIVLASWLSINLFIFLVVYALYRYREHKVKMMLGGKRQYLLRQLEPMSDEWRPHISDIMRHRREEEVNRRES